MPQPSANRLPAHSAGWRVMRIVSDRAAKGRGTGPADWLRARHRHLSTDEAAQLIKWRITAIRQAKALTRQP